MGDLVSRHVSIWRLGRCGVSRGLVDAARSVSARLRPSPPVPDRLRQAAVRRSAGHLSVIAGGCCSVVALGSVVAPGSVVARRLRSERAGFITSAWEPPSRERMSGARQSVTACSRSPLCVTGQLPCRAEGTLRAREAMGGRLREGVSCRTVTRWTGGQGFVDRTVGLD